MRELAHVLQQCVGWANSFLICPRCLVHVHPRGQENHLPTLQGMSRLPMRDLCTLLVMLPRVLRMLLFDGAGLLYFYFNVAWCFNTLFQSFSRLKSVLLSTRRHCECAYWSDRCCGSWMMPLRLYDVGSSHEFRHKFIISPLSSLCETTGV